MARRFVFVLGGRLEKLKFGEERAREAGSLGTAQFQVAWEAIDGF